MIAQDVEPVCTRNTKLVPAATQHSCRRTPPVVALTTVALLLGGFVSPAWPQSGCMQGGAGVACNGGEPPAAAPGSAAVTDPEAIAPGAAGRPPAWRVWPGAPGGGPRGGWPMEGTPFPGPDGRMCWPHGDHFHCR